MLTLCLATCDSSARRWRSDKDKNCFAFLASRFCSTQKGKDAASSSPDALSSFLFLISFLCASGDSDDSDRDINRR